MKNEIVRIGNVHEATAALDLRVHRVLAATTKEEKVMAIDELAVLGEAILCATDPKVAHHLAPLIPVLMEKLTKADPQELPKLNERAMQHLRAGR